MKLLASLLLAVSPLLVAAQQPGHHTPEVHPPITWNKCAAGGHCTPVHGGIVHADEWRWLHTADDKNCYTGSAWDATICPDEATCTKNCFIEGIDYKDKVITSGTTLRQNFGTRTYLLKNETHYETFHLNGQEFTFDVDMSKLPCGSNGALYLIAMDSDGGMAREPHNKAGAKYGTGYCDSQCPRDKYLNYDNANPNNHGRCCTEMDIWEANSMANAMTTHPCVTSPAHICSGDVCKGNHCAPWGCGYNPYQVGNHSYYGPGKAVDTNKVFTVVTQFITADGTAHGDLTEIRRFYVQGGHVIPNTMATVRGQQTNAMDAHFCEDADDKKFQPKFGGIKRIGEALEAGMVLSFAVWDDPTSHMDWLDQVTRNAGPCPANGGIPSVIEATHPYIVFSNMKFGPINSTFTH